MDFRTGKYQECLEACTTAVTDGVWNEDWYTLKMRVELLLGRYAEAKESLEIGLRKYSSSIRLRLLGYEALRFNNEDESADAILASIDDTVRNSPWRFSDSANRWMAS